MLTFEDKWKLDDNRRKDTRKDYRGKIEIVMLKRIWRIFVSKYKGVVVLRIRL